MQLDDILEKLNGVRKSGNEYTARCPAHDDHKNSLSVGERDGKLLLYCYAGCSFKSIAQALDLQPEALAKGKEKIKPETIREISWDITDETGAVVATHHRKDFDIGPKDIWWSRNGTKGLGGLKTSELPLYGLPWLLGEPENSTRDIFIVEGEPAADALHEAGYLALGTVTGASGTPSEDVLVPLLGRKGRIILWPDADKVGWQHMMRIAQKLHSMGVECYILEWKDAPEHGDAADFLAAGRDITSLLCNYICMYNASGHDDFEYERDKNGTKNGTNTMHEAPDEMSRFEGLTQRVKDWVQNTNGWFETRELDIDLGVNTARAKDTRKKILQRLREQGIIESHPKINKQWRYIDTSVTSLDFRTAQRTGALPIKWPLKIERFVHVFPGNLVVVAGSPNAGKTALLLHFIYLNQDEFPVYYFCSEMGEVELRDRLEQFPGIDIQEWSFKAFERASDFADVLVPDAINVIDYLEMTDELYNVNKHLTAIHQKIGSGVAVVAIQKKVKADYGRGQEFSLEKPKVYLSLDAGRLKIVKGKSWARKGVNPNGLRVDFGIQGGAILEELSEWTAGER